MFFRKFVLITFLLLTCLPFSGCFYLVLGGVAAAGGYAVSQDTIQGETQKDFEEVWDAAAEIISIMGNITSQSEALGKISAIVNSSKVTVQVLQLTPSTVRLKVKARKNIFPNIANAQNIFVKIMNRVNQEE